MNIEIIKHVFFVITIMHFKELLYENFDQTLQSTCISFSVTYIYIYTRVCWKQNKKMICVMNQILIDMLNRKRESYCVQM